MKSNIQPISLIALFLVGCGLFPESSFELANESRLPRWFQLPEGATRGDVKVRMDYYISSSGRDATFTFSTANNKTIKKVDGSQKGLEPLMLKNSKNVYYPSYEIITVDGITEVIEHRKMEPIFYITDDPGVLSELGVTNPSKQLKRD